MTPPAKIKGLDPIDDKSKMFRNIENYKERKRFSQSKLRKKEVFYDRKHF